MKSIDKLLENDILTSHRTHNIYYNYFLFHFTPLKTVKALNETYSPDSDIVMIHDAEPHDIPDYLNKFHIPVADTSQLISSLSAKKKVFLFSRFPNEIENDSFIRRFNCKVRKVNEGVSYHNLFELTSKENP
jgi:hypothetical protein